MLGKPAKLRMKSGPSFLLCLFVGSLGLGFLSFLVGFVGPMIFMPASNQGPLIGIFITGPLGFLIGGLVGIIYWVGKNK
jgi:hypothetical protein